MSFRPAGGLTGTRVGSWMAPPYLDAFVGGTGLPPSLYCSGSGAVSDLAKDTDFFL